MVELERYGQSGLKPTLTISGPCQKRIVKLAAILVDYAVDLRLYKGGCANNHMVFKESALTFAGSLSSQPEVIAIKLLQIVRIRNITGVDATLAVPHNHIYGNPFSTKEGLNEERSAEVTVKTEDGEWKEFPERQGTFTVYRQQSCYLDEADNVIRSSTPRITIEEFEEDKTSMPRIQFKQEYCLDFIATVSDVYSEDLRDEVLYDQEYIEFGTKNPVVAGMDVGKMRNETVLYIAEVIPDPKPNNKAYKRLDLKWHKTFPLGTKYSEIEDYVIYELPVRFPRLFRIVVDATGVGEAIWETIHTALVKEQKRRIEVEPFKFSKEKKKDLVESCLAALERGQVAIPWNKRLNTEMAGYKREITDSNNYVYQKTAGSDDYVDAMNLCIYNVSLGLVNHIPISLQAIPKTMPRKYNHIRSTQIMTPKRELPKNGEHTKQVKILNSHRRRL